MLKFDVEGSEYIGLALSSNEALEQFSIISGEFHALDWCQKPEYCNIIYSTFAKLANNFTPVHVHANNGGGMCIIDNIPLPSLLEVTFMRNDLFRSKAVNLSARHFLDRKNCPGNPDILWNPAHFFVTH